MFKWFWTIFSLGAPDQGQYRPRAGWMRPTATWPGIANIKRGYFGLIAFNWLHERPNHSLPSWAKLALSFGGWNSASLLVLLNPELTSRFSINIYDVLFTTSKNTIYFVQLLCSCLQNICKSSLHSKRFRASPSRKLGRGKKKKE